MLSVLIFGLVLLGGVLLSALAQRSVLSTAVLFLAAGVALGVAGQETAGRLSARLIEVTLVAVLFSEGMRVDLAALRDDWRLPGRALWLGLPLTVALIALAARGVLGLDWPRALLLGAVLSPTDPVFAEALVGAEGVPVRIRRALNVESGLNDGLALPAVVLLSGMLQRHETASRAEIPIQVVLGVVIGVVVPWTVLRLERLPFLGAAERYQPLLALAIGVVVFAAAGLAGGNTLLAAFVAGVATAALSPEASRSFAVLGRSVSEVLKLGALLAFGASVLAWEGVHLGLPIVVFAAIVVCLVRPIALSPTAFRTGLPWRQWLVFAWFGPRGFASVLFILFVAQAGVRDTDVLVRAGAAAVALSIVVHSSTDVLVARWIQKRT